MSFLTVSEQHGFDRNVQNKVKEQILPFGEKKPPKTCITLTKVVIIEYLFVFENDMKYGTVKSIWTQIKYSSYLF